ncbi:hypothetical protein C8F01DRAFT_1137988 [Mycena amicta]|nr:hypothetical protein C8F01DRAFT_1137988 [Mycena amicta]
MSSTCLEANPDISGLGVRISFYLQTLALVLLTGRSLEEALSSVWTLLGTSFGLAISALVTATQNQLPLYQAIIVTDLIWLANFAIFMALAAYSRHPRGSYVVQYCAIAQTYVSMGCVLYLWARAKELDGVGRGDDKTVFVVMFAGVSATGMGRTVALAITTVLLAAYSGVAWLFLWRHVPHSLAPESRKHSSPPATQLTPLPSALAPPPSSARSPSTTTRTHRFRISRTPHIHGSSASSATAAAPPSLSIDPHLAILTILFLLPYLITLICAELQIGRNDVCPSESNSWGFGQVLALTVTIIPVVITVQAFRRYGWSQRPRERAGGAGGSGLGLGGQP